MKGKLIFLLAAAAVHVLLVFSPTCKILCVRRPLFPVAFQASHRITSLWEKSHRQSSQLGSWGERGGSRCSYSRTEGISALLFTPAGQLQASDANQKPFALPPPIRDEAHVRDR